MGANVGVTMRLGAKLGPAGLKGFATVRKHLGSLGRLAKTSLNMSKYIAGAGLAAGTLFLRRGIGNAIEFRKIMAEVSTIVDTSTTSMKALSKSVMELSKRTGKGASGLAKGLYQTISAGVTDAAKAMKVLEVATKSSIAGVAETQQAVKLLTSIVNAYGLRSKDVMKISDLAFKTVEKGVTRYEELAESMGDVIPFAAQLDVEIRDLFAAVATLTKGGMATDKAVTQLKGALMAVIKPSTEMAAAFEKMGGPVAAIKKLGLPEFLKRLQKETGGDTAAMAKLIPKIRGLGGVLALTGKQAGMFKQTLKDMEDASGVTEVAFRKMMDEGAVKLDRALNRLHLTGVSVGQDLLPTLASGAEKGAGLFEEFVAQVTFLNKRLDVLVGKKDAIVDFFMTFRRYASLGLADTVDWFAESAAEYRTKGEMAAREKEIWDPVRLRGVKERIQRESQGGFGYIIEPGTEAGVGTGRGQRMADTIKRTIDREIDAVDAALELGLKSKQKKKRAVLMAGGA